VLTCWYWSAILLIVSGKVWPETVLELLPVITVKPLSCWFAPVPAQICCSSRAP
jgi:hypothetical protein